MVPESAVFFFRVHEPGPWRQRCAKNHGYYCYFIIFIPFIGPTFYVPLWVIITCNFVMALGTLLGGWRIVKTMGMRITKLKPVHGSCAEFAGAIDLICRRPILVFRFQPPTRLPAPFLALVPVIVLPRCAGELRNALYWHGLLLYRRLGLFSGLLGW